MTDKYGFFQTTIREDGEIIAQMADKEIMGESRFVDTKKALDAERVARSARFGSGHAIGAFNKASAGTEMKVGVLTMTETDLITLNVHIEVEDSKQSMPDSIAAIERAVVCINARRMRVPPPEMKDTHQRYIEVAEAKHAKILAEVRAAKASEQQPSKAGAGQSARMAAR
jgi:hypothetical protein